MIKDSKGYNMENKFLTIKETSELLRINISTINRFIKEGKIPSYKVGKRRLFDRDELIEWVKSQKDTK
jgi:excisionase family DNA binding protein